MGKRVRPAALLAIGLLAMSGACGESSGDRPGVLEGTQPFDAGHHTGSGSGTVGGSSGSGSSSGGVSSCPTQMNGCNNLPLCGPQVKFTNKTGTFPTPAGGTVVAGTYVLSEVDYYGSMSGWFEETFVLSTPSADAGADAGVDAAADTGASDGGDGGAPQTFTWNDVSQSDISSLGTTSGTLSATSATTIAIDYSCPLGMAELDAQYTATSTGLMLMIPTEAFVFIYQKM